MTHEPRILIFGGTTEGRLLAEFCEKQRIPVWVSVATEYGSALLPDSSCIRVLTGRKDRAAIEAFLRAQDIRLVLDATHPFAVEAGHNIAAACEECGIKYVRVLRESGTSDEYGVYFDTLDSIITYLNNHPDGNILLTTGSKELSAFRQLIDFSRRCAARVLPVTGIPESCAALGFLPEHIIAAKGPFTKEQNLAHLRQFDARYLVTKESGSAGGFAEKIAAAKEAGACPLILRRPAEHGVSLSEAKELLQTEYRNESE